MSVSSAQGYLPNFKEILRGVVGLPDEAKDASPYLDAVDTMDYRSHGSEL
jgi:hypothetical protein